MPPFLLTDAVRDGVMVVTMNQPEQRNPLTGNTAVAEFLALYDAVHTSPEVRCLVLTGSGSAFSAGGDIREMQRQSAPEVSQGAIRQQYRGGIQRLAQAWFDLEVPVIAAINGHALGAGLDLACLCDIRLAAEQARFAESFVRLGIIPGDGGAWLLPRAIGWSRAAEMAYTGEVIDAWQALAWNLVSRVVPAEALLPEALALAARIAANPGHAVRFTKRLMRDAMHNSLQETLSQSAVLQAVCHKTPDHQEAVSAFLEKRVPRFRHT